MPYINLKLTLASLLLAFTQQLASAGDFVLYTEEYPPINFSRNGKASGLGTEVVQEIMRRIGVSAPIEVVPWARAYKNVTTGSNVILFVTTRTEEREKLFKWVGPVSTTSAHLYQRRDGPHFESMEQARSAERILIPREWYLHQVLRGSGYTNIYPVPTPVEAIRMLAAGRAPLMAMDDVTLADSLNGAGVNPQEIVTGPFIMQSAHYIAFWRNAPDEMVNTWQSALDEMKADGSFARIHAKWLPGATAPGKH